MQTVAARKKPGKAAAVETALVLRANSAEMTSYNGFVWPSEIGAVVEAPDWIANRECGNGLHGWLYGAGDHDCSKYATEPTAKWMVVEVVVSDLVMLGGKVKFPRCVIKHVGDRASATGFLVANSDRAKTDNCIGASVIVGDGLIASVGALGTATAGALGTATAGDRGSATAGDRGTATAGDRGTLCIRWYDCKNERYRTEIAYVGESGILPNVAYRLDAASKFEAAK